ncbi:MAG: rhamnulokinase [Actinobacteria bacterium]|nr:rhamnulokinase [Actinomycetota bacterium]
MEASFLAFDLGAESGRAFVGSLKDKKLLLDELDRFPNEMVRDSGHLHWDIHALFRQIKKAINRCSRKVTSSPSGIGIDTWGVDFALLDRDGAVLGLPFAYRDDRTEGTIEGFTRIISRERLYELTGIQLMRFNTLFQLFSMVRDRSPLLEEAGDLLFMPDLFNYMLTGEMKSEFTFATTSQLFNPSRGDWEQEIFDALGISSGMMQEVVQPGTVVGSLSEKVGTETGLGGIPIIATGSHDTASAVAAVPAEGDDWAYISSGTWSLMGVETTEPVITADSIRFNFTNEGGVYGTNRFLKNIMGLWLLQRCREAWAGEREYSYEELADMAGEAEPFQAIMDPDHEEFLNPPSMPEAIARYLGETGQRAPRGHAGLVRVIMEGLALRYREVLEQLRKMRAQPINRIHIVGGGSRNRLLCRFTSDATGLPVIAGPVEATAAGNVLAQAMGLGFLSSLEDIRRVARSSFELEKFTPAGTLEWDTAYERFLDVKRQSGARDAGR